MSNIIRTCKSGTEWTINELKAYNIKIIDVEEEYFFNECIDNIDLSDIPQGILLYEDISEAKINNDFNSYKLLRYLDLAMKPIEGLESAVDDFAAEVLKVMKYEGMGYIVFLRKDINLLMCGYNTKAQTDVCVMDDNNILLLIQEDKYQLTRSDPEPQLIAEAIAAFQHNNIKRRQLRLNEFEEYTFPGIIMIGTRPLFYKIKITTDLNNAIQQGCYTNHETIVQRFDPLFGRNRFNFGMLLKDNRIRALKCFKAFRKFVITTDG